MFIGLYPSIFDANNKLEIPAGLRELLAGRAVITQGFERNLLVLPVDTFQNLFNLVAGLNIADPLARGLQRMLLGNASFAEIDENGRLSLPDGLRDFAQLAGGIVLVGQGKYLEVWAQTHWNRQEADLQDAEANAQRFVSLNLAGL